MSRPLRLDHAGALWHVTSRGNERREVFVDDEDRREFLRLLGRTVELFGWKLHAWVLMGNHYHLFVGTPEATLSRGMRQLNGDYAQHFNRRHGRDGHVFQGRFKAILVQREAHLLEVARYVVRNPVRAGIVASPGDWPWSSYRATAGLESAPEWLDTSFLLEQFGSRRAAAATKYREFVLDQGAASYDPWGQVLGQIYLGSASFAEAARGGRNAPEKDREVPRTQREPVTPPVDEVVRLFEQAFELTLDGPPPASPHPHAGAGPPRRRAPEARPGHASGHRRGARCRGLPGVDPCAARRGRGGRQGGPEEARRLREAPGGTSRVECRT